MRQEPSGNRKGPFGLEMTWSRDWVILIVFGLVLLAIVARLLYVQIIKGPEFASMADSIHTNYDITISARRGTIYDRNGEVLASNVPATTIYVNPKDVNDSVKLARMLEEVLGSTYKMSYDDYYAIVTKKDTSFAYIQRKADTELAKTLKERLEAAGLRGIHYLDDTKRIYPNEAVASQLVGVIDTDGNGIAGLEMEYDELLGGEDGAMDVEHGATDIPVVGGTNIKKKAVDGTDIVTSIDISLQKRCEERLKAALEEYEADSGSVTVMDAATGEIYAACSYGKESKTEIVDVTREIKVDENGNEVSEAELQAQQQNAANAAAGTENPEQQQTGETKQYETKTVTSKEEVTTTSYNREVGKLWPATDSYEPGSTFKPFTAIAVLENNSSVTPQSTYTVPYSMEVYDATISDSHEHGVDTMTLEDILAESSNVGITLVSREVTPDKLYDTYNSFGFGTKPATDFPGVAAGVLQKSSEWDGVQTANVTFGQGVSITGLELISGYGALEQHGVARVPHFLTDVPDDKTKASELLAPLTTQTTVADAKACDTTSEMLKAVVDHGTGEAAAVDGFTVTGKTGTAEIASVYGGYEENAYIVSFCGWLYGSSSNLICLVTMERPRSDNGGGDVCGPVFADIMSFAAERYQVDAQAR